MVNKGSIEHRIGQVFVVGFISGMIGCLGQAIGVEWIKVIGIGIMTVCGFIFGTAILVGLITFFGLLLIYLWQGDL
jgi:hypothetical protein